jgi:large subunit ribosomal protein L13
MKLNKTYMPKGGHIERKCYVIDAKDKVLGRVAAKAAAILRGKYKVIYTPFLDTGDTVVIINAAKIRVTGKKLTDKLYEAYSGYPSGIKVMSLGTMLKKSPIRLMRLAVNRMIPKGSIGYHVRSRLRVYADDKHPHQAQKPIALSI